MYSIYILFLHERTFIFISLVVKRNWTITLIGFYGAISIKIIIIIIIKRTRPSFEAAVQPLSYHAPQEIHSL